MEECYFVNLRHLGVVFSRVTNHENTSEVDLVTASRREDLSAFEELMRRHQAGVRAYFRSRILDWTVAEDLAQEVFVTAYQKLELYRGDTNFEAYLRGISHNYLRNYVRKRREQYVGGSAELQELSWSAVDEWEGAGGNHRLDALKDCLDRLDGPSKEILMARYAEGRSVKELSEAAGRGYSALTMQLHRLRELLAECVKNRMEEQKA